jgi:hypothetical protein
VGLSRGPLSRVRINEELLQSRSRGFGLENRDLRPWGTAADHTTLIVSLKLALKFAYQRRSLVGIVRLQTKSHRVCLLLVACSKEVMAACVLQVDSFYCWNEGASSSVVDVHSYVIFRESLASVFSTLLVLTRQWQIQTDIPNSSLL